MTDPAEIPQLTTELIDMSREYLRQETVEPAKKLGKHAGLGIGGAAVMAAGAICSVWGVYHGLTVVLPEGDWWVVIARLLTGLVAAGAGGIVGWRLSVIAEQAAEPVKISL